ncbi:MAG: hypothetical protein R3D25_20285, partial [Geminicoccaceae bacterium]
MEHTTWHGQLHGALVRGSELVDVGGPVVAVLLGLSVLATAIVIAKAWQLAAAGLGQRRALAELGACCRQGDTLQALRDARRLRGPAGAILVTLLEGVAAGWEE